MPVLSINIFLIIDFSHVQRTTLIHTASAYGQWFDAQVSTTDALFLSVNGQKMLPPPIISLQNHQM